MGRQVDVNQRFSEEDRAFLLSRGRGYLIPANERRFGTNENPREPEAHETGGRTAQTPFYDPDVRDQASYDLGGAPLPHTILDYNTGRVADRVNGKLIEPIGPGYTPGGSDLSAQRNYNYEQEGFISSSDDDGDVDIDDDIVETVLALATVEDLRAAIDETGSGYSSEDDKENLQNILAVALQDARDEEKANA